ncbi:hypothetical protein [Oscillatoria sp. HE19RPO]|nr:hypothetical protein [Oscillatoria sp. HE19RPO]
MTPSGRAIRESPLQDPDRINWRGLEPLDWRFSNRPYNGSRSHQLEGI